MSAWNPPYNIGLVVSPDDAADFTPYQVNKQLTQAIYVGTTGDVVGVMGNGATMTFKSVPAGVFLPIAVRRVNGTNTTAANMLALYEN